MVGKKFPEVYAELKKIIGKWESKLVVLTNKPDHYYLNTPYVDKYKKELEFGVVQIRKNYVSFHLFPVYMFPDLLDDISDDLRKRMQGKSCFNFKAVDKVLFKELKALTQKGFRRLKKEKLF